MVLYSSTTHGYRACCLPLFLNDTLGSFSAAHRKLLSVRFCDILSPATLIVNIRLNLNWHLYEIKVNHSQKSLQ